jgi:hypothetical protein
VTGGGDGKRRLWLGAGLLVLAGSALLRVPGLSTELWLDELWSLETSLGARSWWQLLFQTKIDNNHHLTSLYLYFIGAQSNPIIYRLLAFVSGIATVATAWIVGARDSRLTATITALLFGSSYLMVFYATEARGYATVVWLTLAAWYFAMRYAEAPQRKWAAGFAVCSVLGVMAHQTFIMFFAAAYLWLDARFQRTLPSLRAATRTTRRLFLAPGVVIGLFYVTALLGQQIGGGPPYRLITVVAQTLSAIGGGPQAGAALWVAAAIVGAVFVVSIWSARRADDDRWLLYAAGGFVIPAIVTVARQPETLSPRYFIVPAAILLLGAARWLSRRAELGGAAMVSACALVAAHVAGGVLHTIGDGASRGHYGEALQHMAASSTGDVVTVASADRYGGHDFRTGMVIRYYGRTLPAPRRVQYVVEQEYPSEGTDWMIVESLGEPAEATIVDRKGRTFSLAGVYPAGDLSGTTWYLYRRA